MQPETPGADQKKKNYAASGSAPSASTKGQQKGCSLRLQEGEVLSGPSILKGTKPGKRIPGRDLRSDTLPWAEGEICPRTMTLKGKASAFPRSKGKDSAIVKRKT